MLTGTIINALAILAGSAVGLGIHALAGRFSAVLGAKGIRLGERLQTIMMQGISLCVLYVGVTGSLKGQNTLVAILSMVAGSILGELLDLDARMGRLGQWVQDKLSHILKAGGNSVADGFVTASLVFCVGAMAIVGALENGLTGNFDTLKAKAVLDMHGITTAGSEVSWQRLTSRLCIFGKPAQEVPASVLQLRDKPTHIIMSESAVATIKTDDMYQY